MTFPFNSATIFIIELMLSFIGLMILDMCMAENTNNDSSQLECDLYLAPSLINGAGRGIFAGKSYTGGEVVDTASSLTVLRKNARRWPLHNYVYSSNDDKHSMALFGPAMMFNHGLSKDVEHFWEEWPVVDIASQKMEAHTVYTAVSHRATRDIGFGEEIFTSYGDYEWFSAREIEYNPSVTESAAKKKYTKEKLSMHGHCLSDVRVGESTLPLAGKGLFAKRSFQKDEIVSISPVLVLPKHAVAADEGVLLNYCISTPRSDVALFPVGLLGMINHGGGESNVALTWFAWDAEDDFAVRLKKKPDDLFRAHFAQLDISIKATRDIAAGEELFLNYGEDWERAWLEHLDVLDTWWDEEGEVDESKPQFRRPIGAPVGLFPKWWRVSCIGPECQMIVRQAEIEEDPELLRKQAEARVNVQAAIQRARELAKKTYKLPEAGMCDISSSSKDAKQESKSLFGTILSFWGNPQERDK